MSKLSGAISYNMDTSPNSPYDPADLYLSNRPESYNGANSFLDFVLSDGVIGPRDLYILGVSGFPNKKVFRIKDSRIAGYLKVYTDWRKRGAAIITKNGYRLKPTKIKNRMNKILTPYAYVSSDLSSEQTITLEFLNGGHIIKIDNHKNWVAVKKRKEKMNA